MIDDLAPPDYCDPVIEAYKKDVDRTLLRENLKLTVDERFRKFAAFMKYIDGLRGARRVAPREGNGPMTANFNEILPLLVRHHVRFIVIGGGAAIAHGLARATYDVAVVYDRATDNLAKIVAALQPHKPYLRGAPAGLPFRWDERTLGAGLNFTLVSDLGDVDLLGEVSGGGTYEQLLPFSEEMEVFGVICRFVTLEKLIQLKRAAGRPKDLEIIAELQALLEERRKGESAP